MNDTDKKWSQIRSLLRATNPTPASADLVSAVMGEIRHPAPTFWRVFPWAAPAMALVLALGVYANVTFVAPSYSTERLLSETVSAEERWLVSSQPPAGTVLLTNFFGGESRDR